MPSGLDLGAKGRGNILKRSYRVVRCIDFDDFISKIQQQVSEDGKDPSGDKWVFRGQRDACWELATNLGRACDKFGIEGRDRLIIESKMMREFSRRQHHYASNVPGDLEADELMALMQHHGAPTRLLDVTYSPYVAAFFAFEGAARGGEIAIWAINTDWCKERLRCRYPNLSKHYTDYQQYRGKQSFKSIFIDPPRRRLILSITPHRLNERLAYQRGAFLCPGDFTVSFMQNLDEFKRSTDQKAAVIKFIISTGGLGEIRDEALLKLDLMNVNRVTLFPGLDGFAQSFESRIPFFKTLR